MTDRLAALIMWLILAILLASPWMAEHVEQVYGRDLELREVSR